MSTSDHTDLATPHQHDLSCYWDHHRCGWVCPPTGPTPPAEDAVPPPEPVADVVDMSSTRASF
jgi:hypothetical protein